MDARPEAATGWAVTGHDGAGDDEGPGRRSPTGALVAMRGRSVLAVALVPQVHRLLQCLTGGLRLFAHLLSPCGSWGW